VGRYIGVVRQRGHRGSVDVAGRSPSGPQRGMPPATWNGSGCITTGYPPRMHYDAHQPVIDDLEARILTIRDSL